jgi:hypothetical protein
MLAPLLLYHVLQITDYIFMFKTSIFLQFCHTTHMLTYETLAHLWRLDSYCNLFLGLQLEL